jgi:glucosylglycerate synthase
MVDRIPIEDLIPTESLAAFDAAGPAELLVGVPALNHARSIAHVLECVAGGLAKHFPTRKIAVLVADAGSQDGTLEAVHTWKEKSPDGPAVQDIRLTGPPHRGRAVLAILIAARRLEVQACGFVDANLTSVAPGWVYQLLQPVVQGDADYVSPTYTRPISEGTLTTNLVAPMTRALYGKRVREVMGGCLGLSAELAGRLLQIDIRPADLAAYGMDLWLTTEALASGARVAETHLGRKIILASPGEPDLPTTLARVAGSLFSLMERYHTVWEEIGGSSPLPQTEGPASLLPETGEIQVERMVRAFKLGLKDLLPVWEQIMPEETLAHLYPLGVLAGDEFRFPPPLWARVVSDFAVAFHERRLPREHLLRALAPLYLGRVAAFLLEANAASPTRFPDLLEGIGRAFEEEKNFLRARWR